MQEEATVGANRQGHGGPRRRPYCRRDANEGARARDVCTCQQSVRGKCTVDGRGVGRDATVKLVGERELLPVALWR